MLPIANIASPTVWIIALIALVLLFGGQKIPEMMKGLGLGMKEFKKGMSEEDDELRREREKKDEVEREVRARVEEEMRRRKQ